MTGLVAKENVVATVGTHCRMSMMTLPRAVSPRWHDAEPSPAVAVIVTIPALTLGWPNVQVVGELPGGVTVSGPAPAHAAHHRC